MTGTRVILVTVTGPRGHVDVGVRSDATPFELAGALGGVIGLSRAMPLTEHRSPPRPGVPQGRRVRLRPDASLGEVGVADGDLIMFKQASDNQAADRMRPAAVAGDAAAAGLTSRAAAVRAGTVRSAGAEADERH